MMNRRIVTLVATLVSLIVMTASSRGASATTYTVTTTADSGPGSLRQVILNANANPGLDTIDFAIGVSGSPHTIQPTSALPSITDPVVIDGWSQGGAGYSGAPLIEINGASAGSTAYGLRITSGSSTVRGLIINGFASGTGVILLTAGGNWIYGNFIGVNAAGNAAAPNVTGISINADSNGNVIGTNGDGTSDAVEGNLISGNSDYGLLFAQANTTNNVVAGNIIGADSTGTTSIPNGTSSNSRCGIYLGGTGNRLGTNSDGVSDALERNLISGNHGCGITLNLQSNPAAAANVIAGNFIGTDNTGLAALPNSGSGLASSTGPNYKVIIRDNVISGNSGGGIAISGLNQGIITGNFIGVAADGSTPLGNGSVAYNGSVYGIYLAGSDNQIGGSGPGEGNLIANQTTGAAFRADGIALGSAALRNTIRGNRIYANKNLGIDLNDDNIANPNDDGDGDTGANTLQNFPVIGFAQSYVNGHTVITGTLNSMTNTTYTLDFYASTAADDSGYGEGEFTLGSDQVTTDGSGAITFTITLNGATVPAGQYVTATATDPDGNTSEFSPAFGPVSGVQDVPIDGLTAQALPPIYINMPATFVASVSAGTNVTYTWDFGDGSAGSSAFVTHIYTAAGPYTATVSAGNNSGSAVTSTLVTALEPANFNGVVWYDKDEDGFFGLGESSNLYPGGAVVTATLQSPLTVLSDMRDNQGNYQILTPQAGLYVVEVGRAFWHATSASPVAVAMATDGGVTLNFGMNLEPSAGTGRINGRAWIDGNSNGYPDPGETPLSGLTVTVRSGGSVLSIHATDVTGWINIPLLAPGTYGVDVAAPPGYYPQVSTRLVTVAAGQVVNAHAPFLPGGSVNGQVSGQTGAGIGGITLTLLPDNVQTTTAADGSYHFSGLAAGDRTLHITPPPEYVPPDGVEQRFVPVALNSGAVENWTLLRKGQLTIKATQFSSGLVLPVGEMFFELFQGGNGVGFAATDWNGQAVFDGLLPGTYSVRPLAVAVLPGSLVNPAERTAIVTYDSAATLSFSFGLARSISLHCLLPGAPPHGFDCLFEIRNSGGNLIASGALPAANSATTLWNLNPATLEVRLIPDPTVPGQASWPTHSQLVILNDNTHADVYYPFNPSNAQTISGYAFWDHCAPIGSRGGSGTCSETGAASNNGLTVTLKTATGTIITTTQTGNGTGLNSGYFAFPDVVIGAYRVTIELPAGFAPTTSTEYAVTLDGIAASQQVFFGYQLNATRMLAGRAYFDLDANGQYDPAWEDVLSGAPVTVTTPGGQLIADRITASDGSFTIDPIAAGDYRVTLTHADLTLVQVATVPATGGIPLVDFALPPDDALPRVLIFVDANYDGVADADEQRLSGVTVNLFEGVCALNGGLLHSATTNSGGLATFAALAHDSTVCARAVSGLPADVSPASPAGVLLRAGRAQPLPLAVLPNGTLRVRPFLDANGNATPDNGESYVSGGTATVNNVTRAIAGGGATFLLPTGTYSVNVAPPAGYAPGAALPLIAHVNGERGANAGCALARCGQRQRQNLPGQSLPGGRDWLAFNYARDFRIAGGWTQRAPGRHHHRPDRRDDQRRHRAFLVRQSQPGHVPPDSA